MKTLHFAKALCIAVALWMGCAAGAAAATIAGTSIDWEMDADTLRMSGSGAMPTTWTASTQQPWNASRATIRAVVMQGAITTIGNYAFAAIPNLQCVDLSGLTDLTNIGAQAFFGCSALQAVDLPNGLRSIGNSAFEGCSGMMGEIKIPASVSSMGTRAFYSCSNVTSLVFETPSQLTVLPELAFYDMPLITHLVIPEGITTIGTGTGRVFEACLGLSTVSLPSTLQTISNKAFFGNEGLRTINFPPNLKTIGMSAFQNCSTLDAVQFPQGLTEIVEGAFMACSSMRGELRIPSSVTRISSSAFRAMDISSLVFDSPSELRTLSDLSFGDNKSLTKVELPEGLVELGSCSNSGGVFENCPALQHVTLPSTLTLIGKRAFYGNSLLSSVNFPQGLQTICDYAFYFCTGLTSIDLPDGLATIGNYAFNSCSGLQGELKLPASLSSLGPAAFSSCGSSSIKFFSPTLLEELPYNAFAFMPNLESLELPEGLKRIGPSTGSGNVFAQCEKLQTVNFPSTLKEINTEAFWRCRLLSSIHLPQGLETIGNYAFVQSGISSGMGDLVIPASVKKIGNYAFEGTLFTGLHFEQGSQLTTIGNYAFNSCTNLADINLPEGLLTIGNNAFVGTIASSLTIPQSVTAIGTNAFSGCNKLAVVTVKPPVPLTVNANVFANVTLANVQLVPPLANECAYATAPVWSGFKIEPAPCCPGAAGLTGISGSITWAFDCGEGKLTISRTAATGTVAMPTTYANATAQPWYKMRHRIRTVVIDSGVTTVGQYAFYGAVLLDSVSLPEGLTAVNASAFELCVALPRIAFPSTLTTLGSAALGAAAGLKKITMNAPYFDVAATVFTNTPLKPIELWLNTAAGNKADFYDHAVWSQMTIRNGCTDGQEVKRTGPSGTITWEVDYCTKTLTVHPPNGTTGRIPNYGTTAAPWYPYRAHIEKVVVQDGITTIGNNAFYGITTLLDARIESTQLDTICTGAFQNCPNLLSLYFASTADTIPKPIGYCFGNNTANDFVKAKVSVEVAPGKKCAYAAIPAWRDFYFKDTTRCCTGTVTSTTYDGVSWALHCGVLTISKSGTGVINNKSINEYPWYTHSAKIEKIVVAGGITMGNSAFKGYTALKEVEFEGTPIILGSETFSTCTRLRYVKGWQNVTSIGTSAFNGCTALEGPLNLRSVTALGQTAFTGCTGSLDTVYMPDSLTSWGNNSFQNASNMKTVIFPPIAKGTGYTAIPEYTFSACSKLSGKLTIPYGITAINRYAFYNHRLLDSVILPATLLTLGVSCFEGSNGTTGYQNMTQLKYVEFPSSLLTIQTKAFLDCNKLQGVLDLQSVTTFDEQCFNRCTGITGIKLGTQGHAITVGVSAFANCTGTTGSLNLTYVTNLTDNAFTNAAFTDTLYMPKVLLKWNTATLNGCNKVRYLVFPDTVVDYRSPAKTIPSQAFYNWPNLRGTVKIPIGIATIANSYAFANTQIDSVMFPVGFKTVGQLAFDACRNLKYVGFPPPNPAGAVAVGNYAFRNCANLQTPPDFTNVKSIGDYAFQNCEAMTGVLDLKDSITVVGNYVFDACGRLTGLKMKNVTTIGNRAFYRCSDMTGSLWLRNVTSWGDTPFYGTGFTDTLYMPHTVTAWESSSLNSMNKIRWLDFPDTVNYKNSEIPDFAFYEAINLRGTVKIPHGIVSVGNFNFYNVQIKSVILPAGFKSIGRMVFTNCSRLADIKFPPSLTTIGEQAFQNDKALRGSLDLRHVRSLGAGAFSNCGYTDTLYMPDTLTFWGADALSNLSKIKHLSFPDSVTYPSDTIPAATFAQWHSLRGKAVIPKGITTLGNRSFYGTGIDSVILQEGLAAIGSQAFDADSFVTHLKYVKLPSSLTSIGTAAFRNCANIQYIEAAMTTPPALTASAVIQSVPRTAVLWCPPSAVCDYDTAAGWKTFTLAQGLPCCGTPTNGTTANYNWSFNCGVLTITPAGASGTSVPDFADETAQPWAGFRDMIRTLIVGEGITSIGNYAFRNLFKLDSLSLPSTLTTVGAYAFEQCPSLRAGSVAAATPPTLAAANAWNATPIADVVLAVPDASVCTYLSDTSWAPFRYLTSGGCCVARNRFAATGRYSTLWWEFNPCTKTLTVGGTGAMPDYGAATMPWYALRTAIRQVVIDSGVNHVGNYAFYNHPHLDTAHIAGTVVRIGNSAFSGCTKLTSPVFHPNLVNIGNSAFKECANITEVQMPATARIIGDSAFYRCSALTSLDLNQVQNVGRYAFQRCGLTSLHIPGSVNTINYSGFSDNLQLTSLTFDEGLQTLGAGMFYGCTALTGKVALPLSLKYVSGSMFLGCEQLDTIVMPEVTDIGSYAFYGCSNLTSLSPTNIPKVVSVGRDAFRECKNIESVEFPVTTTHIGEYAFENNTNLATLDLNQVVQIGERAFFRCGLNGHLHIPGSVISIGNNAFTSCAKLQKLTFDEGLRRVGDGVFNDCSSLNGTVRLPSTLSVVSNLMFLNNARLDTVVLPVGVTVVQDAAFSGCTQLVSINLPLGLNALGDRAFQNCELLRSLNLPATLNRIGNYTFYNAGIEGTLVLNNGLKQLGEYAFGKYSTNTNTSRIKELVLPAGLSSLGAYAFSYCTGLTLVTQQEPMPPTIASSVFQGVTIANIPLIVPIGSEALYKSAAVWTGFKRTCGTDFCSGYTVTAKVQAGQTALGRVTLTGAAMIASNKPSTTTITADTATYAAFKQWNITQGASPSTAPAPKQTIAITNSTSVAGNYVYEAEFVPTTYSITYHLGGGTNPGGAPLSYNYTTLPVILPVPATHPSNTTFRGWYNNAADTGWAYTNIPSGSTGNKAFWAKWEPDSMIVIYDGNNALNPAAMAPSRFACGSPYSLAPNQYNRVGYAYEGWHSNKAQADAGIVRFNSSTSLINSDTFGLDKGGVARLYAVWKPRVYRVQFYPNGAANKSDTILDPITYIYGTSQSLKNTTGYTRSGYDLDGWDTIAGVNNRLYTTVQNMQFIPNPPKDGDTLRLYAVWKPRTYTITLDKNHSDAIAGTIYITATYNNPLPLPAGFTPPTLDGMSFRGYWSDAIGGTEYYSYSSSGNLSSTMNYTAITDIKLYARWSNSDLTYYKVTLEKHNGGAADTVMAQVGSPMPTGAAIAPVAAPAKTGYNFRGYFAAAV